MPGLTRGPVVALRMYGVTEAGNSVMAHVHGFIPYFYVQVPAHIVPEQRFFDVFRSTLNVRTPVS